MVRQQHCLGEPDRATDAGRRLRRRVASHRADFPDRRFAARQRPGRLSRRDADRGGGGHHAPGGGSGIRHRRRRPGDLQGDRKPRHDQDRTEGLRRRREGAGRCRSRRRAHCGLSAGGRGTAECGSGRDRQRCDDHGGVFGVVGIGIETRRRTVGRAATCPALGFARLVGRGPGLRDIHRGARTGATPAQPEHSTGGGRRAPRLAQPVFGRTAHRRRRPVVAHQREAGAGRGVRGYRRPLGTGWGGVAA